MPDEVLGEHADEQVGFDPAGEVVVDRAQGEVVDFDVAPGAFQAGEVLVRDDDAGGVEGVGGEVGADDVDAVEGGFGVDAGLVAVVGEVGLSNLESEVFGYLVLVDDLADCDADGVLPGQGPGFDSLGDLVAELFGAGQQFFPFAG